MNGKQRETTKQRTCQAYWTIVCSVAKLYPTVCNPVDYSTPGFPVPELAQALIVGDAIQPSHPVAPFSSHPQSFPASGSFWGVGCSYQVARVLELQLHCLSG